MRASAGSDGCLSAQGFKPDEKTEPIFLVGIILMIIFFVSAHVFYMHGVSKEQLEKNEVVIWKYTKLWVLSCALFIVELVAVGYVETNSIFSTIIGVTALAFVALTAIQVIFLIKNIFILLKMESDEFYEKRD